MTRIDWSAVMRELQAVEPPMSLAEIAARLEVSKGTAVNLLHGNHEPLFVNGERLIRLWAERTGRNRDMLPAVQIVRTLTA